MGSPFKVLHYGSYPTLGLHLAFSRHHTLALADGQTIDTIVDRKPFRAPLGTKNAQVIAREKLQESSISEKPQDSHPCGMSAPDFECDTSFKLLVLFPGCTLPIWGWPLHTK